MTTALPPSTPMRLAVLASALLAAVALAPANADDAAAADAAMFKALPDDTPGEAGLVPWLRSWDAAVAESKNTGKPLFVQFQELPG